MQHGPAQPQPENWLGPDVLIPEYSPVPRHVPCARWPRGSWNGDWGLPAPIGAAFAIGIGRRPARIRSALKHHTLPVDATRRRSVHQEPAGAGGVANLCHTGPSMGI